MIELCEWARSFPVHERAWMIIGKGPSFSLTRNLDITPYNTISLNHVVRAVKVNVAHFADLEAFEDCAESVLSNADWVLMPYRPHVHFLPSEKPLPELIRSLPTLNELDRLGRLVWYNLSTGWPSGNSPIICTGQFGSEVVVNILATLGVKQIRTVGIDGGSSYSACFADLSNRTLLANGATSFDSQFVGILKTVEKNAIDFAPMVEPIRVFIGTDESQLVPARVLEYSIKRQASQPVEFIYLDKIDVPLPADPRNQPRTGFSFKRFAIPSICKHRGRALYLDADMIVFGDISELWDTPMEEKSILCTWQDAPPEAWRDHESFQTGPQMSVMLMDCSRLDWDPAEIVRGLDEARYTYAELMFDLCIVPSKEIAAVLPPEWNSLEKFEPGKTKLLHYTVVSTQPWISHNNPLERLWVRMFAEAVAAGAVSSAEVKHAIDRGVIQPSLGASLNLGRPTDTSERISCGETTSSAPRWELRMRAAYGEALITQARIPALEREIASLNSRLRSMENSWTWRLGRMITHPLVSAQKAMRRSWSPISTATISTALSTNLATLYHEMHDKQIFPGTTWRNSFSLFKEVVPDFDRRIILDFGCGPKGGLRQELGSQVIAFDPYVWEYSAYPWNKQFDVLFSSDVLEHLSENEIFNFAAKVLVAAPEYIFLNISTRLAHKTFPNGRNVHLTVQPARWWRDTLEKQWRQTYRCRVLRDESDECTLFFERIANLSGTRSKITDR